MSHWLPPTWKAVQYNAEQRRVSRWLAADTSSSFPACRIREERKNGPDTGTFKPITISHLEGGCARAAPVPALGRLLEPVADYQTAASDVKPGGYVTECN